MTQTAAPADPPTVDEYFGVRLVDPYRWLEDDEERARAYEAKATEEALTQLHGLPGYDALHQRIVAANRTTPAVSSVRRGGDTYFVLRRDPDALSARLYAVSAKGQERTLLDIEAETRESGATLDFTEPSPSGKLVAVGVSHRGDEDTALRVLDVRTGKVLADDTRRVRAGVVSWLPGERELVYLRNPPPDPARPGDRLKGARLVVHRLGAQAAEDTELPVLGEDGEVLSGELSLSWIEANADAPFALLVVRHRSVDPYVSVYEKPRKDLARKDVPWRRVAAAADGARSAFIRGAEAVVLFDPPAGVSEVVALRAGTGGAKREVLYRARSGAEGVFAASELGKDLLLALNDRGASRLVRVRRSKKPVVEDVPMPFVGAVDALTPDPSGREVLFGYEGWLQRKAFWRITQTDATPRRSFPVEAPATGMDNVVVETFDVAVRDGEHVPVTLLRPAAASPPYAMAEMLVYGAYGFSITPNFRASRAVFLDAGGVFVFAHVRGGREKGRAWHDAGRGENKIHTVEDTIDVAADLVARGLVRPPGLGLLGWSAGGIPVGMALVQRPELFGAVVLHVPVTSVLRDERKGNLGPMEEEETGSSKTKAGFDALLRIDPYYNVKDARPYPAVLFTAGWRDVRVPHWSAAKLHARLREATSSSNPVLLRVTDSGHSGTSTADAAVDLDADLTAFFLWRLGGALRR